MKSLVILAALAAPVAASPASVLGDVQQFYAKAPQLQAGFRQTVTTTAWNRKESSDGKIWVSKPVKLRAEYYTLTAKKTTMKKKEFIFDGSTLWYIDHIGTQITKSGTAGSALPAAVSFLTGGSQLITDYNVAFNTSGTYAPASSTVLELTPKVPNAAVKQLFFVVSAKDSHITRSIVIDGKGDTNDFAFYEPDTKTVPDAKLFTFNPTSLPLYSVKSVGASAPAPTAPSSTPAPTTKLPASQPKVP